MNYLPFLGYWFYGAGGITGEEMAAYYVSYGLLNDITDAVVGVGGSMFMYPNTSMLM